jgi:hypothetical protein
MARNNRGVGEKTNGVRTNFIGKKKTATVLRG